MPVRVTRLDFAIATMYQQLALLSAGNLSPSVYEALRQLAEPFEAVEGGFRETAPGTSTRIVVSRRSGDAAGAGRCDRVERAPSMRYLKVPK
jgi:hypothetical protein